MLLPLRPVAASEREDCTAVGLTTSATLCFRVGSSLNFFVMDCSNQQGST
jgi:hypothetical protein